MDRHAQLRSFVRHVLSEKHAPALADPWFERRLDVVIQAIGDQQLPGHVSRKITRGHGSIVYSLSPTTVIKFVPAHKMNPEQVDELIYALELSRDVPVQGVGRLIDPETNSILAVWYAQPAYRPLDRVTAQAVDSFVSAVEAGVNQKLRELILSGLTAGLDVSSYNIMVDDLGNFTLVNPIHV